MHELKLDRQRQGAGLNERSVNLPWFVYILTASQYAHGVCYCSIRRLPNSHVIFKMFDLFALFTHKNKYIYISENQLFFKKKTKVIPTIKVIVEKKTKWSINLRSVKVHISWFTWKECIKVSDLQRGRHSVQILSWCECLVVAVELSPAFFLYLLHIPVHPK